jgi:hypothetical protein
VRTHKHSDTTPHHTTPHLHSPPSYQYLARLLKAAGVHYEKPLALFVAYCAELCLVDYSCLRFSSTEVAAAIMYVAMRAFGKVRRGCDRAHARAYGRRARPPAPGEGGTG